MEGIGGEERPGIVHRLDKDTSGLIVIAKNEQAHRWLQDQFRPRTVEKVYLALVDGKPPTPSRARGSPDRTEYHTPQTDGRGPAGKRPGGRQRIPARWKVSPSTPCSKCIR